MDPSLPLAASEAIALPELPIRLVAIDMDGTLLPDFSTVVSERNQRALRLAQQAGIVVAIATGRRQAFTAPLLKDVGLRADTSDGYVQWCSGPGAFPASGSTLRIWTRPWRAGSVVYCVEWDCWSITLDKATAPDLIVEDMAKAIGRLAKWVESNRLAIAEVRPIEKASGRRCGPDSGHGRRNDQRDDRGRAVAEGVCLGGGIRVHPDGVSGQRPVDFWTCCPGESRSARALERLAKRLGIRQEETMAIGDNWNDETMLDWAGTGVLMGNATEELRTLAPKRGWLVGPTNCEDGVAVMLEKAVATLASARV